MTRAPVVDVHTHMLTKAWLSLLEQHGGRYTLKEVLGGLRAIHLDGSPFMTPVPNMFDWEARIANMNKARVDIAITSLSCPNAFWGSPEVSLKAAQVMNDDMARAQKTWPERIRWFASLPWQHEKLALEELARACNNGAVGVMVLANISGQHLTDPAFANIWKEIDRRGLPVLVHPSAPPGSQALGMHEFQLTAPIGFTFDTSLAVARCIYDGFFDRYPDLKLIASHGGGALPYLIGRLDTCWTIFPPRDRRPPSRRATTCDASTSTASYSARTCSTCASRCAAPTTCSTARTIRTPSATWPAACRASMPCRATCARRSAE